MINIGAVWGLGLAAIICFIIYRKSKKKIAREVEVINVTRPKEEQDAGDTGSSSGNGENTGTEQYAEDGIRGEEYEGEVDERGRVQDIPIEADVRDESEPDEDNKGTEPDRTAVPPFEPYEE